MEEAGTEAQEVRGVSARAGARAGGCLELGLQGEGRNQGEAESRKGERSKSWGMSRSIIRLGEGEKPLLGSWKQRPH